MNQTKSATSKLVREIKKVNEDHEFYPTTQPILDCIKTDIINLFGIEDGKPITKSALDCGAGDGRALHALTSGKKYGIEISDTLTNAMSKDIFVIGTDFFQQQLLDKKVDFIFSNPPYEQFIEWLVKIITEGNAAVFYAVVPERWSNNSQIKQAMNGRKVEAKILGEFDFSDADRVARGTVNVVRFDFINLRYGERIRWNTRPNVDPFNHWFEANFPLTGSDRYRAELTEYEAKTQARNSLSRHFKSHNLVAKNCEVKLLEEFYNRDIANLMSTYKKLCDIDSDLLNEMGVKVDTVKEALRMKIHGLKDVYWSEVFNKLSVITNKLTFSSRKNLLDKLTAHTHVDFTASNVHAIVIWVVKNANDYFDSQLVEVFETMTESANVINYKSNQRTFGEECWRYNKKLVEGTVSHYKLDYRIILEAVGGIKGDNTISSSAANLFDDLCALALNMGFDTEHTSRSGLMEWSSNKKNLFFFNDINTGEPKLLFECKAFKNGNLHIKFLPEFICKLNVEHGRLKGWLKSKTQASEELDLPLDVVSSAFNSNYKVLTGTVLKLMAA